MTIGDRRIGARGSWSPPAKNPASDHLVVPADSPSDLKRYERREGIRRRPLPPGLNATEEAVATVLDDEYVTCREAAAAAGVTVHECRRALAALREKGLADARRRGNVNVWRRA